MLTELFRFYFKLKRNFIGYLLRVPDISRIIGRTTIGDLRDCLANLIALFISNRASANGLTGELD